MKRKTVGVKRKPTIQIQEEKVEPPHVEEMVQDKEEKQEKPVSDGMEEEEEEDDDDEDDQEEIQDEDASIQEIQVDFEFFDAIEDDFLSLKTLLGRYIPMPNWSGGPFADKIIAQTGIGSIIKTSDQVYGLITVFNFQELFQEGPFMKQTAEFLLNSAPAELSSAFAALAQDTSNNLGLLINERVVNIPPVLTPPLHEKFYEELREEVQDFDNQKFNFKNYMLLCPVYYEKDLNQTTKRTQGKAAKRSKVKDEKRINFARPEEEVYYNNCVMKWEIQRPPSANMQEESEGSSSHERWTFGGMMKEGMMVVVVNHTKISTIVEQITENFAQ